MYVDDTRVMTNSTSAPGPVAGRGTADDPWILATPPGGSEFEAWRDRASAGCGTVEGEDRGDLPVKGRDRAAVRASAPERVGPQSLPLGRRSHHGLVGRLEIVA